ncbi:gluconate 2-dehydrogenase subunit 3 family protein [Flavobacteriaceae bacterium]|nr:gluconate 2-dehydrogenase subunit 3 family protein [Flavobacteriaceae bacterium]MDB2314999.1 gluconate 2-dehydrogenase subunit 3 family protein [Flavobacteriaceae bacterium]MDC3238440.1 gluconate 2-dehydrogenase subunit 3 family protein [Flavobacteriaceae bacterium]
MERRESIKAMMLGSFGTGLLLQSCLDTSPQQLQEKIWKYQYGRTPKEAAHDQKLLGQQFFDENEMKLITRLANLILPPHENGSIEEAEVPGFIEFIVKDISSLQKPLKKGLKWLDQESKQQFGKAFVDSSDTEQKSILDSICYELEDVEEQPDGIAFFSLIRDLVVTGYFTSAVGLKDLGYQGNSPNVWDGVPDEVLKDLDVAYDEAWLAKCIDQNQRNEVAKWDENGNLLT